LADVIQSLRDFIDGPRLSDDERAVDVKAIILEKETLRIEVGTLRNFLIEANTKVATTTVQTANLHSEIADYHAQLRTKDQKIAELERYLSGTRETLIKD